MKRVPFPRDRLPREELFETMEAMRRDVIAGLEAIDGIYVVGKPDLAMIGFTGRDVEMFAVAEQMTARSWFVSTMSDPPGIHFGLQALRLAIWRFGRVARP